MMKNLYVRIVLCLALFPAIGMNAQCANDNTLAAGSLTPPGVSLSTTQNMTAGTYMLANVLSGASYTVSSCGGSSWDTQITVYDNSTGTLLGYNDDFCGLQSTVSFTATTCATVRILLDQYFCTTSTNSVNVTMTQNTAGSGLPTLTNSPDQAVCTGVPVGIGGSSVGGGGTPPYSYLWSPSAGLSNPLVSNPTATVTSTTTFVLTLTDASGCTATDPVIVTVNPSPTVALGPDVTSCGGPVTLDALNPGSSYLWSTGAGTQTISVGSSGTYGVTVLNSFGCSGSDNINVTINPLPVFSLGADTAQCGGTIVLNGPGGFSGYNWSTGSTSSSTSTTVSDTIGLTVTDANGCTASDTVIATINGAPTVNIGPDVTQCGGSVALDAGNPGSIYFWNNGPTGQVNTVTSSGTYYVDVFSPSGCQSSDTATIVINPLPVVDLGPDTSVCTGSVLLDAGNPGNTYAWSTGPTTQTLNVTTNGTYWVNVTTANGCTDADTIQVSLNVPPTINVTTGTPIICAGSPATLTASGGVSYNWSTSQTGTSITVTPTTTTTYYAIGTDANGCTNSDVITVTVMPNPTASFTFTQAGVTYSFTNTSTNSSTYTWDFGDLTPTSGQQNPTHTYANNGTYTVTLTVTGPCGTQTTSQVITVSGVGIQDMDLANTLSLFPNPNSGSFTLSFTLGESEDVVIAVYDVRGETILLEKMDAISSYNKQITMEDAAPGVYFLRIQTKNGVATQRLVIQ